MIFAFFFFFSSSSLLLPDLLVGKTTVHDDNTEMIMPVTTTRGRRVGGKCDSRKHSRRLVFFFFAANILRCTRWPAGYLKVACSHGFARDRVKSHDNYLPFWEGWILFSFNMVVAFNASQSWNPDQAELCQVQNTHNQQRRAGCLCAFPLYRPTKNK
jgi:hypothetical protein